MSNAASRDGSGARWVGHFRPATKGAWESMLNYWITAIRPKTLTIAIVPVLVGSALAWVRAGNLNWAVIAAAKQGGWTTKAEGAVEVAGQMLSEGEYSLLLKPADGVACQALSTNDMVVVLDFELSESLVQEGKARDLVRLIQQARREAGLHVSDRIRLSLSLPPDWKAAATAFRDYLVENTLASELDVEGNPLEGELFQQQTELGDEPVQLAIAKVG